MVIFVIGDLPLLNFRLPKLRTKENGFLLRTVPC